MLIRAISGTIKGIQQMPTIWLVMLTNAQYSVLLWWSLNLLFVRVGRLFSPLPAPVFPDYLLFSVGVIALWNWTPVQIEGHYCRGNRAEAVIAPPAMQIPVKQDRAIKAWRRLLDKSGTFTRKAWGGKKVNVWCTKRGVTRGWEVLSSVTCGHLDKLDFWVSLRKAISQITRPWCYYLTNAHQPVDWHYRMK